MIHDRKRNNEFFELLLLIAGHWQLPLKCERESWKVMLDESAQTRQARLREGFYLNKKNGGCFIAFT